MGKYILHALIDHFILQIAKKQIIKYIKIVMKHLILKKQVL